ncbi:MAG: C-terminal binding protein [Chloroflexi bacterium]|nr:C-terminal binding protein [Chloroflexota bacterium]
MANFRVVATKTLPIKYDVDGFAKREIDYVEKPARTEDEVIAALGNADAAVVEVEPCTRRVISNLKVCRLIFTPKVGYDNIDIAAATEHGICVANMPGNSSDEVSDHAMALLLACARKLIRLDKIVKSGEWRVFHGPEMQAAWHGINQLRGQTLGLVGFGRIPRILVPKAKAFGLRVLAYDPFCPEEAMRQTGVEPASLETLLRESDFISAHAPLTPETRHMFGAAQLKLMKPTSYLINTARGQLVDEAALYMALVEGRIAGAALDVLEMEPAKMNNPLLKLDNVVLTGHSAHYSERSWTDASLAPAQEVGRILSGRWPNGWINRDVESKYVARWGTMAL